MRHPPLSTLAWIGLFLAFAIHTSLVYRSDGGPGTAPADGTVHAGIHLWQRHNCQGCHQLYGLGGYMGPDLTNVHGAWGPEYIAHFIRNGSLRMPAYALGVEEVEALVAFLAWIDASGSSRVPASAVHWTGTYVIDRR